MSYEQRPIHLDLFSGLGGFALAAQWAGFRTIGFCEIDKYCQRVLAKNFGAAASSHDTKLFPNGQGISQKPRSGSEGGNLPILSSNIFDLDGTQFRGVDLITGGFPCQPFSVAGKRRGAADDRALWPEMFRVISEARPAWVLGENVPGIIPMELDNVLSDLEGIGYATRTFVIPACAVDARHRRDRVWIIGRRIVPDFSSAGLEGGAVAGDTGEGWAQREEQSAGLRGAQDMADTAREGLEGSTRSMVDQSGDGLAGGNRREGGVRWEPEPNVGRVAHGISSRVDRLKGLGNAIVPQVAYEILREIRNVI